MECSICGFELEKNEIDYEYGSACGVHTFFVCEHCERDYEDILADEGLDIVRLVEEIVYEECVIDCYLEEHCLRMTQREIERLKDDIMERIERGEV